MLHIRLYMNIGCCNATAGYDIKSFAREAPHRDSHLTLKNFDFWRFLHILVTSSDIPKSWASFKTISSYILHVFNGRFCPLIQEKKKLFLESYRWLGCVVCDVSWWPCWLQVPPREGEHGDASLSYGGSFKPQVYLANFGSFHVCFMRFLGKPWNAMRLQTTNYLLHQCFPGFCCQINHAAGSNPHYIP